MVDVVLGNKPGYSETAKAHVEVKLHNTGDRRAILTRLHTEVVRSAVLPSCLVFGGEGTYETGRYRVVLPTFPPDGYRRENVLNQELGPDRVDRFRATFEPKGIGVFNAVLYETGPRRRGERRLVDPARSFCSDDPLRSFSSGLALLPCKAARAEAARKQWSQSVVVSQAPSEDESGRLLPPKPAARSGIRQQRRRGFQLGRRAFESCGGDVELTTKGCRNASYRAPGLCYLEGPRLH